MNSKTVILNFVGDVALFKEFERTNTDPFKEVNLPEADFNVANFEFPVCRTGQKFFYDADDEYIVSFDYARQLTLNKFNLYSLANNHIYDYGQQGIEDTTKLLRKANTCYFGLTANNEYDVYIKKINNIDIAFMTAVKHGRWEQELGVIGPNIIDFEALKKRICELESKVDHIIVYLHWGTELVDAPIPADVVEAKKLIESGASCVIGHHPHVPQGVMEHNAGIIAYSLGSFIYLSEFEKGNNDHDKLRDTSICLNIEFSKSKIVNYIPYKYSRKTGQLTPTQDGDYRYDSYYPHLNSIIGDSRYYSKKIRSILLKREILSFWSRFKINPIKTLLQYFKYIRRDHLMKLLG